jgi:hypothetical protein
MKYSEMNEAQREVREREFERACTKLAWSSSDLLTCSNPIEIGGTWLTAKVKVIVQKMGDDEMEVDYLEVRWISAVSNDGTDLLLDQDAFKAAHKLLYEDFIAAVELRAIQEATKAPEGDWCIVDTSGY